MIISGGGMSEKLSFPIFKVAFFGASVFRKRPAIVFSAVFLLSIFFVMIDPAVIMLLEGYLIGNDNSSSFSLGQFTWVRFAVWVFFIVLMSLFFTLCSGLVLSNLNFKNVLLAIPSLIAVLCIQLLNFVLIIIPFYAMHMLFYLLKYWHIIDRHQHLGRDSVYGSAIYFVIGCIVFWYIVRTSLAYPMSYDKGGIKLYKSTNLTKNYFWPLASVYLILLASYFVLYFIYYIFLANNFLISILSSEQFVSQGFLKSNSVVIFALVSHLLLVLLQCAFVLFLFSAQSKAYQIIVMGNKYE